MGTRINKFIADSGLCSRRQADKLVEEGRVSIDGRTAVPGDTVKDGSAVSVDGEPIKREETSVLLLFNKPKGLVCTSAEEEKDNVISYINYPKRITYVGRLDKDSEGLLLLTNKGELVDGLMRSRHGHEKEYIVTVDKAVNERFIKSMAAGVPILDTVTRPCVVERIGKYRFRIIITQGLNLQIRRMCEHFGYNVVRLVRVRVGPITLGDLEPGKYRAATRDEKRAVFRLAEGL
ncbi:MAG: pseudouridine synthase [Candidatus Methanomethylophilaceae archaeon]|jgi:23S rRNA pseudouridine2604 synthase|nr:pseudouridine synthase [Candidatus Methanomethylophilaceae archaeon]